MRTSLLIPPLICLSTFLFAQADTTSQSKQKFLKKAIFPTTLILAGSALSGSQVELKLRDQVLQKIGGNDHFPIDNYLQAAPIAEMYLADLVGIRAQNHWFDQSKNLLMTDVLNQTIVTVLKYAINKTRPNGNHHSFPSGHTSFAFANATVLYEEFRATGPVLAYSGFGFATTTGTLRILNNRHWLSDVMAGAGIGILSAKIIYHFQPLKNWNPFRKKKNLVVLPQFSDHSYALHLSLVF